MDTSQPPIRRDQVLIDKIIEESENSSSKATLSDL